LFAAFFYKLKMNFSVLPGRHILELGGNNAIIGKELELRRLMTVFL